MATTQATPLLHGEPQPAARKRTRRACDRCSSLRTRCDGQQPCRRCEEYQQRCHYARVVGKRGRKPGARKSQAAERGETRYESSEPDQELEESPPRRAQDLSFYNPTNTATGRSRLQFASLSTSTATENPTPPSLASHGGPETTSTLASQTPISSVSLSRSSRLNTQESSGPDVSGNSHHVPGNFASPPGLPHSRVLTFSPSHSQTHEPQSARPYRTSQSHDTPSCKFRCLEPILPALNGIVDAELASELLNLYFVEPGGSLFRSASPYILTHVMRKESVLRSDNHRRTTPALLVTMLWASAQEAESSLFLIPGQKARVCEGLRQVMLVLINDRDRDSWNRNTAGLLVRETGTPQTTLYPDSDVFAGDLPYHQQAPSVDDVLTFAILTIVVSGGVFKSDCFRWWNKALRLSRALGLNREDDNLNSNAVITCTKDPTCGCRACDADRLCISVPEAREERRRVFWLLFCLDRHLGLSFNTPLSILDDECRLYCPLPDDVWQSSSRSFDLDLSAASRAYGPPTAVTGISFFEYFLPLMTVLGDVIQLHRRKCHPRFGSSRLADDHAAATSLLESIMADCARSITDLSFQYEVDALDGPAIPASQAETPSSGAAPDDFSGLAPAPVEQHASAPAAVHHAPAFTSVRQAKRYHAQAQLVTAYSSFILHVLHVLLHGKWDAVSMLENKDGWISSVEFVKCASHSIAASDAVSRILACDPELAFMPYLFGIYLLHGSFILLLFADRMPQVGLNESVERACETIIRAHEICVVTLQTEFQKQFRKVLRSTLYSVRSAGGSTVEESTARRRALSLYRWSSGSTGLAL